MQKNFNLKTVSAKYLRNFIFEMFRHFKQNNKKKVRQRCTFIQAYKTV